MPVTCPNGDKPRFRVVTQGGEKRRLAFCGDKVVENVPFKKSKGKLKKKVKKK